MIGKMKSNGSLQDTLHYNIKEHSEIIAINNVFGDNWKEIEMQMSTRQKLYEGRAQNLTAHIFLSPSIADGKKLSRADWKEIASSFLQKAELNNHQSIAFLHQDKDHYHLHIVANRIDERGNLYRHKNELALSQRLGDEIAKERGMVRASVVMKERQAVKNTVNKFSTTLGSFEKIREEVSECARLSVDAGNNFRPEKYFNNLKAKGFKVKIYYKKSPEGVLTDKISGYALGKTGERLVKASALGNEFILERLTKKTNQKRDDEFVNVSSLKSSIESILNESFTEALKGQQVFNPQIYFGILRSKGLQVKEHFNSDTGKLRGYGIEKDGQFFNASEIGSSLTLSNLNKQAIETIRVVNHITDGDSVVASSPHLHFQGATGIPKSDSEEGFARELIHAIDLARIESDLKDSTSGHRYKSYQEFIQAIEQKGYHIHLRYNQGQLAGYTVHSGCEHYHDKDIANGEYSLHKLIKSGLFVSPQIQKSNEVKEKSQGVSVKAETGSTTSHNMATATPNSPVTFTGSNSENNPIEKNESKSVKAIKEIPNDIPESVNPNYFGNEKLHANEISQNSTEITADNSEAINNSNQKSKSSKSPNDLAQLLSQDETQSKPAIEKEKARKKIAADIGGLAKQSIIENKSFDTSKFLDALKKNGFDVTEHKFPDSGLIRGYSVHKYGFTFQASELASDLTLGSLKKLEMTLLGGKPKKLRPHNRI